MPTSRGYSALQPKYILGTDQWISATAEQMVGADDDRANQLRDHFPFYDVARGHTLVVPRVARMATAGFVGDEPVATDTSFATLEEPADEVALTSLVGTVDLASLPKDLQSYSIDQLQLQIEMKKIAIRIRFWGQFFLKRQPRGFRGLPDLVDSSQQFSAGGALSLAALDNLVASVTEADAEMDHKVLVMHSRAFLEYVRLVRGTGASLDFTRRSGRRYAAHNGVAIMVCDYVPVVPMSTKTRQTDIWCATLGMEHKGIYGVVPPEIGDNGLVIEFVQGNAETDAVVHRVRWYAGVVLGHKRGLARLQGVRLPG